MKDAIQIIYLLLLVLLIVVNFYLAVKMKGDFVKKTFYFSAGTLVAWLTIFAKLFPIDFLSDVGLRMSSYGFAMLLMISLPLAIYAVNRLAR